MALVVITLSDDKEGTVSVSLRAEPPFKDDEDYTPAQSTAMVMLNSITADDDTYEVTAIG